MRKLWPGYIILSQNIDHRHQTRFTPLASEDDRIADANVRRQAATLSCNCAGWTSRCAGGTDASRTCRHVEQETATLRKFKAGRAQTAQPVAIATARQFAPERAASGEWVTLTEAPKVRSAARATAREL